MDEDKVLKFIKDVGLDRPVTDDDITAYHDYFDVRLGSSEESGEDEEETAENEGDQAQGLLTDSFLDQVPTYDPAEFGNDDIQEGNVIIEIEGSQNDLEVIDDNDEGEEIVRLGLGVDEVNDDLGSYASENDRQLIVNFLEKGCGCKDNCGTKFTLNSYMEMRFDAAEIDHYRDHVNILDQVILGQLRCLRNDSDQTERSHKQNFVRKQSQTLYLINGQRVCRETYMFCHQIKVK